MKAFIEKHSKLIFFIISLIIFIIISAIFTYSSTMKIIINGEQVPTMDAHFSYKADLVFDTFNRLGEEGRKQYTLFHILDYFFIISYFLLMISMTKPFTPQKFKWIWITFPLIPSVSDLIENTLIEIASANFPNISYTFAKIISIFTSLKWSTGLLWFAVFLILLIIYIVNKIKEEKKKGVINN
jgi:hypothetical protein